MKLSNKQYGLSGILHLNLLRTLSLISCFKGKMCVSKQFNAGLPPMITIFGDETVDFFIVLKKTKDGRSSMGKLVLSPSAFFMKYYFFPPTLVLGLVATLTMELGRIGHRVFFSFSSPPRFVSTS